MPEPCLERPSMKRMADFAAMIERALTLGETGGGFALIDPASARDDPAGLLRVMGDWDAGRNLPAGYVRQSTFWLIDGGGTLCGETRVRHELSPTLEIEGGHVGYFVHPDRRGVGLGKAILRLALDELRTLAIRRALVTCNADNVRSRRVIEINGGTFRKETTSTRTGKPVMTFWVPTVAHD